MRKQTPIELVEIITLSLRDLRTEIVFVGGAIVGLLLTDPAAPPISSTKDVDVIISVTTLHAYSEGIGARLRQLGFTEDGEEGAPLCRWRWRDGIKLDVMPTDPRILGFSNRWFPLAYATATHHTLPSGAVIRVVTAPCFLGTKLEAFSTRGGGDFMQSKDIEDICAVVHGRPEIVDEVRAAPPELREYLARQVAEFVQDRDFVISIEGHLPGEDVDSVLARLSALAAIA